MMTIDASGSIGGVSGDPGAGASILDVFNNAVTSAEKAFSNYNASANTPPPANTIQAIGSDIVKPVALIAGALLLFWILK